MNFLLAAALALTLSWTDNSDNEEGFKIYRRLPGAAAALIATVPANVVTWNDPAGEPGACYWLTAFISVLESAPSNTACAGLPPNAPSGASVTVTLHVQFGGPTP